VAKSFRLKNTFPDGDGSTMYDEKTAAAPLCEPFCIDLENLITTSALSTDSYPFWRSNACVATSHRDGFQEIDPARTAIGHFVTAGPIYLTQNREAPLRVPQEHDIHFRTYQIISTVKIREF